jgi:hypothetical protein
MTRLAEIVNDFRAAITLANLVLGFTLADAYVV